MGAATVPRMGYLYDTNEQSLGLLQYLNVTLENPAGSGKKVIIEGYSFVNTLGVFLKAQFIHMPTVGVPVASLKPFPYMVETDISNPDNAAIFKFVKSANAMSGGTPILGLPLEPNSRNYIESTPLTIAPGVKLGLSIQATVAATLTVAIYSREEAL